MFVFLSALFGGNWKSVAIIGAIIGTFIGGATTLAVTYRAGVKAERAAAEAQRLEAENDVLRETFDTAIEATERATGIEGDLARELDEIRREGDHF